MQLEFAFHLYRDWYNEQTGRRTTGKGAWLHLGAFKGENPTQVEAGFLIAAAKAAFKQAPPPGMGFAFVVSAFNFSYCNALIR